MFTESRFTLLTRSPSFLIEWIFEFDFLEPTHPYCILLKPPFFFFHVHVLLLELLCIYCILIYFIYLFLAVLGLRFCARAFSSCGKWGPLFIAVRGPLTVTASLVAEHRLQTHRLSRCGSRAQLLHSMWDLPGPGLEPASPALAGRLSTTAPPGKPFIVF